MALSSIGSHLSSVRVHEIDPASIRFSITAYRNSLFKKIPPALKPLQDDGPFNNWNDLLNWIEDQAARKNKHISKTKQLCNQIREVNRSIKFFQSGSVADIKKFLAYCALKISEVRIKERKKVLAEIYAPFHRKGLNQRLVQNDNEVLNAFRSLLDSLKQRNVQVPFLRALVENSGALRVDGVEAKEKISKDCQNISIETLRAVTGIRPMTQGELF